MSIPVDIYLPLSMQGLTDVFTQSIEVPESLLGEDYNSGGYPTAILGGTIPDTIKDHYQIYDWSRSSSTCALQSITVTLVFRDLVYRSFDAEYYPTVFYDEGDPEPERTLYVINEELTITASTTTFDYDAVYTRTETPTFNASNIISPLAISVSREELEPHNFNNGFGVEYICSEGFTQRSNSIDADWFKTQLVTVLGTFTTEISDALDVGDSIGESSIELTESQNIKARVSVGKYITWNEAYQEGSFSELWNGNYSHVIRWEKRSLAPRLYNHYTMATILSGLSFFGGATSRIELSEDISTLRLDPYGVYNSATDDPISMIPFEVGFLAVITDGVTQLRFLSVPVKQYRLLLSDGDVDRYLFVDNGVETEWDGKDFASGYFEFISVEEWDDEEIKWKLVAIDQFNAYWTTDEAREAQLAAIIEEYGENLPLPTDVVSGTLTIDTLILFYGRARGEGDPFGFAGFTDADTRYRVKTLTYERDSCVEGVSASISLVKNQEYNAESGLLASDGYVTQSFSATIDGNEWVEPEDLSIDEPSYPYDTETNTIRETTESTTDVDKPDGFPSDVWLIRKDAPQSGGKILETTTTLETVTTETVEGSLYSRTTIKDIPTPSAGTYFVAKPLLVTRDVS